MPVRRHGTTFAEFSSNQARVAVGCAGGLAGAAVNPTHDSGVFALKRRLPALAAAIAVSVACSATAVVATAAASPSVSGSVRAPVPTASVSVPAVCPGTFEVLNNDRVGSLSLPAGPYLIRITGNLSCTQASSLFTTFLDQWTGKLSGGWVVTTNGFRNGATAFTVTQTHHKPPSPAPSSRTCPGQFSVLHNTRIGAAPFAQGNYVITLLKASTSHFSCQTASRTFAYFLNTRYSKPLPYPWLLTTKTSTFTQKTNGVGFRAAPVLQLGAPESGPKVTAGGGETVGVPCRPLYAVTTGNARIDNFLLDKGEYQIWAIGNLSCPQARQDVARAVALRTTLPKGWKHDIKNAIVTVGNGNGFRLKLAP
jgi:hypothetical protein